MANKKDFATSLVATAPSPAISGTSLTVTSGEGARFPTAPFFATVHDEYTLPTLDTAEKIEVTAVAGDVLTIVRGVGDTVPQTILQGWRISNSVYADDFTGGGGGASTLVASGTDFTGASKNITGLSGDTDLGWRLTVQCVFDTYASGLQIAFNNDTNVNNYGYGLIGGGMDGGSGLNPARNYYATGNLARINLNLYGGLIVTAEIIIMAKSGGGRTVSYTVSEVFPANNRAIGVTGSGFYAETATEITTINLFSTNGDPIIGNYWLHKLG